MQDNDYYKILGIEHNATFKEIKNVYRRLALKYHPDRNNSNSESLDKMRSINEAYAVLSDENKRLDYDTMRHSYGESAYYEFKKSYSDRDIFMGSNVTSILEEVARSFGLRGSNKIFHNLNDSRFHTRIFSNEKAYFGKNLNFNKRISLLFLERFYQYFFNKIANIWIPRKGSDVQDIIWLSNKIAHEGGSRLYKNGYGGQKLLVKIPRGVKDGQKLCLRGFGKNGKNGGDKGDLYLKIRIKQSLLARIKGLIFFFLKK